jgi:hypothetical protein
MRLNKFEKQAIFQSIKNDIPGVDELKVQAEIQKEIAKLYSPGVKKLAKTEPTALRHADLDWYEMGFNRSYSSVMTGNVTKDQIKEICKPYKEAQTQRRATLRQLQTTIESISTLAQAKKLLPEFVSYFPTETEPTKNLPAMANLVADLSKMGWPKGAKK